jgi:hypothetical protein
MPDDPLIPDPPKCARCSGPVLDGELVLRDHGDWLHVRCKRVVSSSEQIRRAKLLGRESRKLIESGKERIEASRRLEMLEIVERVASAARQQAYCFPCLAVQLQIMEPHVRSAAQILVVCGSFKRSLSECHSCRRTDDVLVLPSS